MLLITKELAEAVIAHHVDRHDECYHCDGSYQAVQGKGIEIVHDDNCIVVRAKLLLEQEWGIKS